MVYLPTIQCSSHLLTRVSESNLWVLLPLVNHDFKFQPLIVEVFVTLECETLFLQCYGLNIVFAKSFLCFEMGFQVTTTEKCYSP